MTFSAGKPTSGRLTWHIATVLPLVIFLTLLTGRTWAEEKKTGITILLSNNFAPYRLALKGIRKRLEHHRGVAYISSQLLDNSSTLKSDTEPKESGSDIIVTIGTRATIATLNMHPACPVIFSMVLDPTDTLLKNPNTTGVVLDIPAYRQLSWFRRIAPASRRIGVIYTDDSARWVKNAERAAIRLKLEIVPLHMKSTSDLPDMLDMLEQRAEALWAVPDGKIYNTVITPRIILFCLRHRIPFMGLSRNFTRAGALVSLDCDYEAVGEQTARIILAVMAGRKPSEIPPQVPHKIIPSINIRTARLIGLKIPEDILEKARIFAD